MGAEENTAHGRPREDEETDDEFWTRIGLETNKNDRAPIRLELTNQQIDYLMQLVKVELWGETLEEVCERLILEGLQRVWPMFAEKFRAIADGQEQADG